MTKVVDHADKILEQFTKQATPFAEFQIHSQEQSLEWIKEGLRLSGVERILDAGCGPGLVATFLAPHARELVGVDATPAMLAKARELAEERQLANLHFLQGTMEHLEMANASFDGTVTRYTLHHVVDPEAIMKELCRVTRPGGRLVVCDAAPRPQCRDAYDDWERIRDPSHTSACTPEELRTLAERRLDEVSVRGFRLETDVEALLDSSFPEPGGRERLLRLMAEDVGVDRLDMGATRLEGRLRMSFPVVVVAGSVRRPA